MMFPGGVERALGVTEASEWFDWMRRQISCGGIALPREEAAVCIAEHALRLRDRIRSTYRHLPASLGERLIESVIVYQCWKLYKEQYAKTGHITLGTGTLSTIEAERYIRPVGDVWGYHLVEGHDGLRYIVTVPTGLSSETAPASEVICNRLLRVMGLIVPDVKVVIVNAALLKRDRDTRLGRGHGIVTRAPELCAGFRQNESSPLFTSAHERQPLTGRNLRDLMGALVFDIWTLNISSRRWTAGFDDATGRIECMLAGNSGGFHGGDWAGFIGSTYKSQVAPQAVASRVKGWSQLDPWLRKASALDLNSIWELAFQMPEAWYGGCRPALAALLESLGRRQWDLSRATLHFLRLGYLPSLKKPSFLSALDAGDSKSLSA